MEQDIRDHTILNHKDIIGLNFIRSHGIYHFRRHYREGLRSHIMELLTPKAVENETKGMVVDGLRLFPRAEPSGMLRIFKTRFKTLKEAEEEIKRVKIIAKYLAPDNIAKSQEFIVNYFNHDKWEIILCGLQEYVKGVILDPWAILDKRHMASLMFDMGFRKNEVSENVKESWINGVREQVEIFIRRIKKMILEANYVPDLAGIGNLIITPKGNIKLVDINNISNISFDSIIKIDDRGYPVCDKSIEALFQLEKKMLKRSPQKNDLIYRTFLDPARMDEVKALERKFYSSIELNLSFPD
ncbi:MAG: hypothetical protein ACMUIU_01690 [bacterium]